MWQGADKLLLILECFFCSALSPLSSLTVFGWLFFFQALLERTGYTLDVTTGQRKYGGPPPDTVYSGVQPGIGTEVGIYRLIALYTYTNS